MNTAAKLGAYGASLALAFGGAVAVGSAVGPIGGTTSSAAHGGGGGGAMAAEPVAAGLEVSADGYTLVPTATAFEAGGSVPFAFRIDGPDGRPLTRYEDLHTKELHLIVVRRDLSGYQHVHPVRDAAGTWSVPLDLATPGSYRVLADFKPTGSDAMSSTLGVDIDVAGYQQAVALPAPSKATTVDGYEVTLDGTLVAGEESTLTLAVAKDGKPVTDLQPYLAAYGHLVALRRGDLAYLHVHPDGAPGDGTTAAGPGITFHADVPSVGTYRLFLDFRHRGQVRTAELTARAIPADRGASADSHGADGAGDDHDQMEMGS